MRARPTLFSLYLTAMLDFAFGNVKEGIYIQTRSGADVHFSSQKLAPLNI